MLHWHTFRGSSSMCIFEASGQHSTNIIPLLIVLLAMEKLVIFLKNCSFPDFFLPISDSEFCAALGSILDFVSFTNDGKVCLISSIFSENSTFFVHLCHFFRVFFNSGWALSLYCGIVGWQSAANSWRALLITMDSGGASLVPKG